MQSSIDLFFSLIVSSISRKPIGTIDSRNCDFAWITYMAEHHDILQIIADGALQNNLSDCFEGGETELKKAIFNASYRDSKNKHTFDLACETLDKAGIEYMPLKGCLLKKMYPESWLRSSCDNDILVRRETLKTAAEVLQNVGFKVKGRLNYHDLSLLYDDTNLELHFSIRENIKGMDVLLDEVWDNAERSVGFMYLQTNDYFVFHHIAHMMHHFVVGGCGVRPFIDLWILKRNNYYNDDVVKELCRRAQLYEYYCAVCETIQVWFEGKPSSEIVDTIREYSFYGGVYGNYPNNQAVNTVNSGGRIRNVIYSAFPRYENMCVLYPSLKKTPLLLPFCYINRFYIKLFGRDKKRVREKLISIKNQDNEFIKKIRYLFNELNLKK